MISYFNFYLDLGFCNFDKDYCQWELVGAQQKDSKRKDYVSVKQNDVNIGMIIFFIDKNVRHIFKDIITSLKSVILK